MHWTESLIHFIDFEGTSSCGVIEYGIVTLKGFDIRKCETRLCLAQGEIPVRESRQHGILKSDTSGQAPFSQEWERFSGLRLSGPLGAHHAVTENRLLKNTWPYPSQSPDFLHSDKTVAQWGPWIDTCRLYEVVFPKLNCYRLIHLIEVFSLQDKLDRLAKEYCPLKRRRYHCALYDALGAALLLQRLGEMPGFGEMSLFWLLTYSSHGKSERAQKRQREFWC